MTRSRGSGGLKERSGSPPENTSSGGLKERSGSPPVNSAILAALGSVRDPELDEPITDLGFVTDVEVGEGKVRVRLRLPTYFCAPNFAYLMVADAREAVEAVPGAGRAEIVLQDHHDAERINAGVAGGLGFAGIYGGEAAGELDELRLVFRRKAYVARQERLARSLLDAGRTVDQLAEMHIGDLPDTDEARIYLQRRGELGLDVGPEAFLLVDPAGVRVPADRLVATLRFAQTVRVSIEGNASFCRGMLATRYGLPTPEP
jgi:metal-sulfur cluster biosynthetic enzyme